MKQFGFDISELSTLADRLQAMADQDDDAWQESADMLRAVMHFCSKMDGIVECSVTVKMSEETAKILNLHTLKKNEGNTPA